MTTAIAMAVSFATALVVLAPSVSGVSMMGDPSAASIPEDPGYGPSGDSNGRHCPCCDSPMKLCLPPSPYKWICHSCGYCLQR